MGREGGSTSCGHRERAAKIRMGEGLSEDREGLSKIGEGLSALYILVMMVSPHLVECSWPHSLSI